jgi:hypothetical protein
MSAATPTVPATTPPPASVPAVIGDNWWDDSNKFAMIQRAAKMFSMSPLVPKQYQGEKGIGSCVIALNMAHRMKADPLMVMQNLYIVHERPAWSSQFLIACFNQTGRFTPIRYLFSGTEGQDDWGCTAFSTDRETGDRIEGPLVTIKTAKDEGWYQKNGSKWKTIPRLMLMYRAAGWLVRTHAPELTMGLQSEEEARDTVDAEFVRVRHGLPDRRSVSDKLADVLESKTPGAPESDLEAQIFAVKTAEDVAAAAKAVAAADIEDPHREYLENLLSDAEKQVAAG